MASTASPTTQPEAGAVGLTRGFLRELEGLRGIAILVVMVHRFWPREGELTRYHALAELGWVGVDLFFVISGFLIAGILFETRGEPGYYKNFYSRRALRIFPLYYLFVGGALVAFPLMQGGPYFDTEFVRSAGSPLWYLFYAGNVPEMLGKPVPFFLGPVWSLAIEEQFYLLFPFAAALLSRKNIVRVLVAAVLFAPVFRLGAWLLFPGNERIQYLATPSRFDEIALGCLLAAAYRSASFVPSRRFANGFALAAALAFPVAFAVGALDRTTVFGRIGGYSIAAFSCLALVLWSVANRERAATAPLRWRPLMFVGKLCYGLYLLHRPASFCVDALLARVAIAAPDGLVAVGLKLLLAMGFATASFYAFERPFLRLKDRFASKSMPIVNAPAVPAPKPAADAPPHSRPQPSAT